MPDIGIAKQLLAELEVRQRYVPRNWAKKLEAFTGRSGTIVAHRRMGKTIGILNYHKRAARNDDWCINYLKGLEPALTEPELLELIRGRQYGHVLPTLELAKKVAWGPLKWYCGNVPGVRFNESELTVKFPPTPRNVLGSAVRLFGADDPDSLRGFPLWGVSYDEYSQMAPNTHGEVVSKSLADHLGYWFFIGTLKGKNHLYRAWDAMRKDPTCFTLWQDVKQSLATEVGATITVLKRALEDDEKQIAMGLMSQEEYDQEWFLSTVAAIKGAYYSKQIGKATREGRIRHVPHDPMLPVHDVWDLGKGTNLAVGCYQKNGPILQMLAGLQGSESDGIPQMVRTLQEYGRDRGWTWGKHFAPHDIKATDLSTGRSRHDTARGLGWEFQIVKDAPIDDAIDLGRALMDRAFFDEQGTLQFFDAIGQYKQGWNKSTASFTGIPVHDWTSHFADMWRYTAVCEDEMTNEAQRAVVVPLPPQVWTPSGAGWTR